MKRIHLITTFVLLLLLLFIGRIAYLQLFTKKYILNAYNTSIKKEVIHPNRGEILDRNGKLLVSTKHSYELQVDFRQWNDEFDTLAFCDLVGISKSEFEKRINQIKEENPFYKTNAYPFQKNLTRDEFAYYQEQLALFPAFKIFKRPNRYYHVQTAGNILGYINEANKRYISTDSNYYKPGDLVGITGVEKSYEQDLRGVKGIQHVLRNRFLQTVGSYKNGKNDIQVESGKTLTLTIDYDLQEYAERLLKNKRGAVVALDPKTGEILVLASAPTINPNDFLDSKLRNDILRDSISKIAFDRASQGMYPPGSTFKMINGLAAMQMGVIDTATAFSCRFGFRYGGRKLRCHDWGTFGIEQAIQSSCNSFFCKTFAAAAKKDSTHIHDGVDEWARIVKSFGLGNYLNNDLAVGSPGLVPSADFYDTRLGKGTWSEYTIISNGIGQGDIQATPLQMANYTAAIANRGFYFTPHIVKEIDGEPIQDSNFIIPKKTLVDAQHFEPIIDGMKRVITRGTARKIRTKSFVQAGKTGTSEATNQQDHSLFILMAPVDDPKIVIATVVENGHYGANWAAPISSLVAEKYITDTVKRRSLEHRMLRGNLEYQYKRNWINYLKRTGQYVEPPKIDSINGDSIIQRN